MTRLTRSVAKGLVPTFSLYGEQPTGAVREFVHIEEISARSAARNWQIDTHTHPGLFQLLFVFSGGARVLLDGEEQEGKPPLAVVIPPGVVHAFKFMPATEGFVLTLDEAGLSHSATVAGDITDVFDRLKRGAAVISLEGEGVALARRLKGLLEQIEAEFRAPGVGSAQMFVWLVRSLLLLLVRDQLLARPGTAAEMRQAGTLATFRNLLEAHFREHRPVAWYAQALRLTESRLNRLCQNHLGSTAFALIQARVMLEARRKLTYTAVPVSQLAYELGFGDPAYFCRFVKKHAGQPPSVLRSGGLADSASR